MSNSKSIYKFKPETKMNQLKKYHCVNNTENQE